MLLIRYHRLWCCSWFRPFVGGACKTCWPAFLLSCLCSCLLQAVRTVVILLGEQISHRPATMRTPSVADCQSPCQSGPCSRVSLHGCACSKLMAYRFRSSAAVILCNNNGIEKCREILFMLNSWKDQGVKILPVTQYILLLGEIRCPCWNFRLDIPSLCATFVATFVASSACSACMYSACMCSACMCSACMCSACMPWPASRLDHLTLMYMYIETGKIHNVFISPLWHFCNFRYKCLCGAGLGHPYNQHQII